MANYSFENIKYNDNLYYPRDTVNYLVRGTQTGSTNKWLGNLPDGISTYSEGLTIDYYLPYAGNTNPATLNLGSGEVPIFLGNKNNQVTNEFPQHSVIRLTYITASTLNQGNPCWKVSAYASNDSTGTVTSVSGVTGLTGTVTTSGSIKANLKSETLLTNEAITTTEIANRIYPVSLDKDGYLAVNVPWENTPQQTIKQDGVTGVTAVHFAICNTPSATAAKTATISTGTPVLEDGLRVVVYFVNSNTADSPTLNLNSLGATSICVNGITLSTDDKKRLLSGAIELVYYNNQWLYVGNSFATSNIPGIVQPYKSYSVTATGPAVSTSSSAITVNSISTEAGKYFAIEMDKDGKMFVNVPLSLVSIVDWTT